MTAPAAPRADALLPRLVRDPCVVAAVVAILVRAAVGTQAFARGVASAPSLDGSYYLDWAGDIASGDLLGRAGTQHGEAFLFNPLYAYVLAPVVGAFGRSPAAVLALQTLLAGATAALAAAAARRLSGGSRAAAMVAGLGVALSSALVHLDGKIAVSGLAAFLVAGAVGAMSPGEEGAAPRRGHGPLAAGVWIGLAALARPVVLPAAFAAMALHARRSARPLRAAALVALPVAVCAAFPFARNLAVSGEPVVFTAANGQNLHLGNNPAARRVRAMATDEFRFGPVSMHEDALYRVAFELGRRPTRSEISSWFAARALDDFAAAPAASLGWYATKLRWFAGPQELGSSDDLATDAAAVPLLRLAAVPTWLLVALSAAAVVVVGGRRDLLLGPGAMVASHALACTLVYPLSHYRSPAIPALAVMAGCAIPGVVAAWRERLRGRVAAAIASAVVVATLGALPPQAAVFAEARLADEAAAAVGRGDLPAADDLAARSLVANPDDLQALTVRLIVANAQQRFADAQKIAERLAALRPWDPDARLDVAWSRARLGHAGEGLRAADEVVALYPWSPRVRSGRGAMRVFAGDVPGGAEDLLFALSHGFRPPAWALERAGL